MWEAVGTVSGGDSLAVRPPSRATEHFPHLGGRTDVSMNIADSAQSLVQMLLWQHPTWPPCAEHQGRHPLRVVHRSDPTPTGDRGRPKPRSTDWWGG